MGHSDPHEGITWLFYNFSRVKKVYRQNKKVMLVGKETVSFSNIILQSFPTKQWFHWWKRDPSWIGELKVREKAVYRTNKCITIQHLTNKNCLSALPSTMTYLQLKQRLINFTPIRFFLNMGLSRPLFWIYFSRGALITIDGLTHNNW